MCVQLNTCVAFKYLVKITNKLTRVITKVIYVFRDKIQIQKGA